VSAPAGGRGRLRHVRRALWVLLWPALIGVIGWTALAIYLWPEASPTARTALTLGWVAGSLAVLWVVRPPRRAAALVLAAFAVVLLWWLGIPPSNGRDWQPDVAVLPGAAIDGDRVTVRGIRNNDYRSETDYTVRHYDRTFDLRGLRSLDLFLVYWGSPAIAHTILSWGFDNGDYLAISIETRKEKGEDYSAVRGFFKQYELTYVVADERDVVRLRTNYRGEDVYLYRLQGRLPRARFMLLSYLRTVDRLREHPEWYNAATHNCTTTIRGHGVPGAAGTVWSWKFLLNGYIDTLLYDRGLLDRRLPFAELKARSYINPRARAAGDAPDFSARIREGLPGF
jgi:hypothetical protein